MSPRAILITLFVSLAINLFLAGALVGGLVIGARVKEAHAEMRGGPPLWAAADGLSPERRQAYRQALRGEAGAVRQSLREARRARRQAWIGMGAEPFDARVVIADLDLARAREIEARAAVERRIVGFAATLTPRERAEFADALARSAPGPRAREPMAPPPLAQPPDGPPP